MDAFIKPAEQVLAPIFKDFPPLPKKAKDTLVKIWPVLALVLGILQLVAAYNLWRLGHMVNAFTDYANQLSVALGGKPVQPALGLSYYGGLLVLVVSAAIMLLAFSPLRAHLKRGWDLLLLGALVNLVYGIVMAFDRSYGGFSSLVSALIGSAIGLYFLFQVREYYGTQGTTKPSQS